MNWGAQWSVMRHVVESNLLITCQLPPTSTGISLAREATMTPVRECIRAAALKKRQARRSEQSSGDCPCQDTDTAAGGYGDPHELARDCLLAGFQALRPVNLTDFEAAIEFSSGQQDTVDSAEERVFPTSSRKRAFAHYDSSSSDSDDDE